MKTTHIVQHPKQLTKAWAQHLVSQYDPNATVQALTIGSVDVGTTTRVRLHVQHNALQLPAYWFIKLPSLAWRARTITALPRLLTTEIGFYCQLAGQLPVKRVRCLAASQQLGIGSTLVLEDVCEQRAVAGQVGAVLTLSQTYCVIEQLAKLHAQFWQRAHLHPWLKRSVRRLEDNLGSVLAAPLMRRALTLAGQNVPASLHKPALAYASERRAIMALLHDAPLTLVHHDCHTGNLFWHNAQQVGFLDWQLVRLGEGVGDVAYLLATALEPALRCQHETALLNHYRRCLAALGIALPIEHLMLRYRLHLSYALEAMLVTLAVGGMMAKQHNLTLIHRAALAVQQQQAYEALVL